MYNLKAILNELMDIDGLEILVKPDKLTVSVTEDSMTICSITKNNYMTYRDHYLYSGIIDAIVKENKLHDTLKFVHELSDEFGWKYQEFDESRWIVKDNGDNTIMMVELPTIDTEWDCFYNLPLEQQCRVYQILEEHMLYED